MIWPRFTRTELLVIVAIVAVGGFLRLYHLPLTVMFRGDQGRDALIAKRILIDHDPVLIGPVTSVGNMYLGPFYYYFMVPFLALTYPSPMGPVYGVALVNIVTIGLLYLVVRSRLGKMTAALSAFIFAIMPYAVTYSRFSWNPNIAPLFSVLLLWSLWSWWRKRSDVQTILIWLWIGILIQLHYVALISAVIAGSVMIGSMIYRREYFKTIKAFALGVLVLVLTQTPLIIFDFRHNHLIWQQFTAFLNSPEKHMGLSTLLTQFNVVFDRWYLVLAQLINVPSLYQVTRWVSWLGTGLALYLIYQMFRAKKLATAPGLVVGWLSLTVIGISFYSHTVYFHYLSFIYPIIAIFWAWLMVALWHDKKLKPVAFMVGLIVFLALGQGLSTLVWDGLGTSVLQKTVQATLPYVKPPYNLVLLSDDHDYKGMSYRYFFEVSGQKPQEIDTYDNLQTLVLIDEVNTPNPLAVPIYELEAAHNFRVTNSFRINPGPRVFILQKE